MRAAVYTRYGPPDVVRLEDVPKPVPGDRDLLVRVRATTVNRTDCGVRGADPWIVRLFTGPRKPRHTILGSEFAGEVEAVGPGVTSFATGDAVFGLTGDIPGAHAEYLCLPETGLVAHKPAAATDEQAGASADGAMLALGALRRAELKRGDKILINGGTGAIGSAGVQLARHLGAEVTAVCRGEHAELVTSLGAARIIDYTRDDFTVDDERYDIVFDAVGKSSYRQCRPLVKRHGVFLFTDLGFLWHVPFLALATRFVGSRRVILPIPRPKQADLRFLADLIERGEFTPVVDRRYPLDSIVDAYRYVETGEKIGNVVITIAPG